MQTTYPLKRKNNQKMINLLFTDYYQSRCMYYISPAVIYHRTLYYKDFDYYCYKQTANSFLGTIYYRKSTYIYRRHSLQFWRNKKYIHEIIDLLQLVLFQNHSFTSPFNPKNDIAIVQKFYINRKRNFLSYTDLKCH